MQETKFERAMREVLISEFEGLIPQVEDHTFSSEFEKKMNKLIRRQRKPYYRLINTVGKRVACVLVSIAVASSVVVISSEAVRNTIANFFMNVFSDHSVITPENSVSVAPLTIEEFYEITNLKGYEIVYEYDSEIIHAISYVKDGVIIDFKQNIKKNYSVYWNTEGDIIETVQLGDCKAMYFYNTIGMHHLVWENEEYVFSLTSNTGKNELIELVDFVQKVE